MLAISRCLNVALLVVAAYAGAADDDALLAAAAKGDSAAATAALDAGAQLETLDQWGQTPLLVACEASHEEVAELPAGPCRAWLQLMQMRAVVRATACQNVHEYDLERALERGMHAHSRPYRCRCSHGELAGAFVN